MTLWPHIEQVISDKTQTLFQIKTREPISGGDINNAYRVSDGRTSYFVKTNHKSKSYMFAAEEIGLNELFKSNTISVPQPIAHGVHAIDAYIIMQYVTMHRQTDSHLFGEKLAQLHLCESKKFGFEVDNSIGSTPQVNAWNDSWVKFWQKQRLEYQIDLIHSNGLSHKVVDLGMRLVEKTPEFFKTYEPKASLLHGDLWSGNWAALSQGEPIIFDPAPYYGDHEADLAMTELFGHPGVNFYASYHSIFNIDEGYKVRKLFYNLYHILNHANLFGGGYIIQAQNVIEQLLVE